VGRAVEKALGVGAILIGVGMIVAALIFGMATPWVTIAASLLGIALLRWATRPSRLRARTSTRTKRE
jgi:hypothetical protein